MNDWRARMIDGELVYPKAGDEDLDPASLNYDHAVSAAWREKLRREAKRPR